MSNKLGKNSYQTTYSIECYQYFDYPEIGLMPEDIGAIYEIKKVLPDCGKEFIVGEEREIIFRYYSDTYLERSEMNKNLRGIKEKEQK